MTFVQDFYLLNLSKALGELGQKKEMHLYLLAKFTKCFRQFQQVKVLKQDQNFTFRCALRGPRIYNLFNIFSLPIWVTFIFEWHYNLSENLICVTFQFERHSNLSDILIWVTFIDIQIWDTLKYEWHFNLCDIPIWVTFHFEWQSIWATFQFELHSILSDS